MGWRGCVEYAVATNAQNTLVFLWLLAKEEEEEEEEKGGWKSLCLPLPCPMPDHTPIKADR